MGILDNVIILLLVIGSFIAGMKISDRYHSLIESEQDYMLRLHAAEKGVGYVAPPRRQLTIGQEFMDKLRENGRATQRLGKTKQRGSDGASA